MSHTQTPAGNSADVVVPSLNSPHMRRILASSFIGSAIEFYDFILYATAASLVFNKVFFVNQSPAVALFASFATLAVGYLARPLGGIIFGHYGDKLGRKGVLITSMVMMGVASTIIGLLPPTAQVGVIAPIALITLRIIQGLAVGGEWGGAMLMALEHAPKERRGFAASFANMGGPAGAVLATLAVSAVSTLPTEQFLAWGWRIPFIASLGLVAIGLVIRLKVTESPLFLALEDKAEERKIPLLQVLTKYPKSVLMGTLVGMSSYTVQGLMTVWAISYVVEEAGMDRTAVLNIKAVGATLTIVAVWFAARYSDRLGRRPVMMFGILAGAVLALPMMWMLQLGELWLFAIALFLANGVVQGTIFGPFGAFTAELFPTRIRYTGASLVYQLSSTLGAGFTPMIVTGLVLLGGGSLWIAGAVWAGVFLIAALAMRSIKEGKDADLGAEHM
ncbi:MHS family MFS transporter [Paeniglutamicibacter sp. ZC-3]|uniref:MFS transporter n=1 Tax=Paeniglutamicibacter TaxID=1742990 RepID=UPI0021F6D5D2|nr:MULTISPECIES: MFS transporter [Paeniglutamicibacter]MCV9994241.1 MHS family MFS transporter [Paeniglutamicibacter sp. ZC-3]MDO2934832.1 MFS transporter [Paeniglutamicibacter sulfureus]